MCILGGSDSTHNTYIMCMPRRSQRNAPQQDRRAHRWSRRSTDPKYTKMAQDAPAEPGTWTHRWTRHTKYLLTYNGRQAALETHRHRNTPRVAKDQQTRDPNTPPAKSSRTDGEMSRNTQIQKHQRRLSTGHRTRVGTHVRKRSWSAQARRPVPATPPGTGTHPGRLQGYLPAQPVVGEVDSHTHTLTYTRS